MRLSRKFLLEAIFHFEVCLTQDVEISKPGLIPRREKVILLHAGERWRFHK